MYSPQILLYRMILRTLKRLNQPLVAAKSPHQVFLFANVSLNYFDVSSTSSNYSVFCFFLLEAQLPSTLSFFIDSIAFILPERVLFLSEKIAQTSFRDCQPSISLTARCLVSRDCTFNLRFTLLLVAVVNINKVKNETFTAK